MSKITSTMEPITRKTISLEEKLQGLIVKQEEDNIKMDHAIHEQVELKGKQLTEIVNTR